MNLIYSRLPYFIWGALGGIVRDLSRHKRILLKPRLWESNGNIGIDLGFLAAMIIGGIVAMVIDHSPWVAFVSAIGAPELVENIIRMSKDKAPESLIKVLGAKE